MPPKALEIKGSSHFRAHVRAKLRFAARPLRPFAYLTPRPLAGSRPRPQLDYSVSLYGA